MKTFKRICIRDYTVTDGTNSLTLHRGQEYTTSGLKGGEDVVVFSTFWVSVPVSIFAGEIPGPGDPH